MEKMYRFLSPKHKLVHMIAHSDLEDFAKRFNLNYDHIMEVVSGRASSSDGWKIIN